MLCYTILFQLRGPLLGKNVEDNVYSILYDKVDLCIIYLGTDILVYLHCLESFKIEVDNLDKQKCILALDLLLLSDKKPKPYGL